VPSDATAVPYAREQASILLVLIFLQGVETPAVELLLRALNVPEGLRVMVLVLDLYSIVAILAIGAGCITRPHVVSSDECASDTACSSTCASPAI
jgi:hypothetical protein